MPPGRDGTGAGREVGPIRVLHVDDDPELLELATTLLTRERPDVAVTTAEGAVGGLEALEEGSYDCIVSDYEMPGRDGLEFLEAVRERYPDLPFVLFTGKGSEEIASDAISAGVTDYLQKRGGREQYAVLANRIENAADRYRAERAVEEARRWHQRLVEESTDVILVVDPDGTIRYTSPSVEGVLGHDPAETTGRNAFEFIHPDDRPRVEEGHAAVVEGAGSVPPVRFRCERADGSWVTLEARSRNLLSDPTIEGVVVYVRDVSGRREREYELDRYASIVEATGDAVYTLDADGRFTLVNDAHEALTGFDAGDLLGEHVSVVMGGEDIERGEALIRGLLESEDRRSGTFEMDVLTKEGDRIPVENHLALLTDGRGEFIGSTGVLRDISERKERELELERYERIVGAMGEGVYALDADGRLIEFNDYVVELTGYDEEALRGASPEKWYDRADFERFEREIRELLSAGDEDAIRTVGATLQTADGESVPVEVNLTLLPMEDGEFRGTVGAIRDVSERREKEREFERYRTVVERVPSGVFVLDGKATFVDCNDTMAGMLGHEKAELIGRRFERLVEEGLVDEAVLTDYPDAVRDMLSSETDGDEATFQYDITIDGEHRVYEVHLALRPYDEEYRGTIGIVQDVTEREDRGFELERYERIVGAMGDGVYVLDAAGGMVEFNEFMVELTGYDRETMLGAEPTLWHDEEEIERFERAIRQLIAGAGDPVKKVDATIERADGESVSIEVNLTLLPRVDGEFRGTVGVVRDVTAQREREEALERYETVVEASGDGVYTLDAGGHYTFMNRANTDILGRDPGELIGEHVTAVMDEADVAEAEALIRDLLESDRDHDTLELDVIDADGERVTTETHIGLLPMPDGEFRGTVGFVRDISARKEREQALERYETLVETSGDAMYALDETGRYTFVNEALAELRGFDRDELLGEHVSMVLDEEDIERGEGLIRELLADDDRRSGTFEMGVVTGSGERVPVENHVALLPMEGGEFRGTVGVLRDISERKEREDTLEWYETIVEATGDQIYSLDPAGNFTYVNQALLAFWGYDEDEILGAHVSTFMDDEDVEEGEALIQELLLSDDRRTATYELTANTRDGERIPVENHLAILEDEEGNFRGSTGVLRDVSERQEREEELRRQNERLDRFASMVSHDLRNPLNIAAGRVRMERKQSDSENLRRSQEALLRMDDIVEDVLSLAREGQRVVDRRPVSLDACATGAWESVDSSAASLSVDGHPGTLLADESRLQQLLENLFRNALEHARPDVAVRVGRIDVDDADDSAIGGFYVEDDGPGIPEPERELVFEYGRSEGENGTGFGLAIVDGIVEAHGWDVTATEGEAGGARFEVAGVEWDDDW